MGRCSRHIYWELPSLCPQIQMWTRWLCKTMGTLSFPHTQKQSENCSEKILFFKWMEVLKRDSMHWLEVSCDPLNSRPGLCTALKIVSKWPWLPGETCLRYTSKTKQKRSISISNVDWKLVTQIEAFWFCYCRWHLKFWLKCWWTLVQVQSSSLSGRILKSSLKGWFVCQLNYPELNCTNLWR